MADDRRRGKKVKQFNNNKNSIRSIMSGSSGLKQLRLYSGRWWIANHLVQTGSPDKRDHSRCDWKST